MKLRSHPKSVELEISKRLREWRSASAMGTWRSVAVVFEAAESDVRPVACVRRTAVSV